jgi:hypothetical protein
MHFVPVSQLDLLFCKHCPEDRLGTAKLCPTIALNLPLSQLQRRQASGSTSRKGTLGLPVPITINYRSFCFGFECDSAYLCHYSGNTPRALSDWAFGVMNHVVAVTSTVAPIASLATRISFTIMNHYPPSVPYLEY